jgi:hypothetical protein
MKKIDSIMHYFKIVSGVFLILIGLWAEINILFEMNDKDIGFLATDYTIIVQDLRPGTPRPVVRSEQINQNNFVLFGLGMIAGAIILTKTKKVKSNLQ